MTFLTFFVMINLEGLFGLKDRSTLSCKILKGLSMPDSNPYIILHKGGTLDLSTFFSMDAICIANWLNKPLDPPKIDTNTKGVTCIKCGSTNLLLSDTKYWCQDCHWVDWIVQNHKGDSR